MHGPGEPVEIGFAPASRQLAPAAAAETEQPVRETARSESLVGTAWRLEDLAGGGVLDRVQATLEFPEPGRVTGLGSCNRFHGVVTVEDDSIRFGGIASTRRACPEAVMRQEAAYFAALQDAERFERDGETLRIIARDRPSPLRFIATEATAAPAANSISRVPSSGNAALAGIWTVVAHHHSPGISALTDEEASRRHGESIRLSPRAAISGGNTCREPRYSTSQVPVAAYLSSAFNITPSRLPPLEGHNQMRVMEVSCGDADWTELGGVMLEVDRDRALAPWDGVFFELARDRDFRASGEPRWQLELRKGVDVTPCVTTLRHLDQDQTVLDKDAFTRHYVQAGRRCWLIRSDVDKLSDGLQGYLATVKDQRWRAYSTCTVRKVWWRYKPHPAPEMLFSSGFVGTGTKVLVNEVGAIAVGSVYGVICKDSARAVDQVARQLRDYDFSKRVVSHSNNLKKVEVRQLNSVLSELS